MSRTYEPDQLLAANEDAAVFYRRHLLGPDGDGPRRYLIQRGFKSLLGDTPWNVGHAPASWTALHDHLSELGYSDDCQQTAGLTTVSRHGRVIDRFRDRITFGIRDGRGQLVGFAARSAPESRGPRYLNTPKTALFDKSSVLFGLGETSISTATTHVLVEGPLDAIAVRIADSSTYAALALCGTALTAKHIGLIRSLHSERLILAFDGDHAGDRALEDSTALIGADRASAVRLDNNDPAGLLHVCGPRRLTEELARARPAVHVLLDRYLERWPDRRENAEAAVACLRETARMINRVRPTDIASLAARLGIETRLGLETVSAELASAFAPKATWSRSPVNNRSIQRTAHDRREGYTSTLRV